jgi:hypothetical protein
MGKCIPQTLAVNIGPQNLSWPLAYLLPFSIWSQWTRNKKDSTVIVEPPHSTTYWHITAGDPAKTKASVHCICPSAPDRGINLWTSFPLIKGACQESVLPTFWLFINNFASWLFRTTDYPPWFPSLPLVPCSTPALTAAAMTPTPCEDPSHAVVICAVFPLRKIRSFSLTWGLVPKLQVACVGQLEAGAGGIHCVHGWCAVVVWRKILKKVWTERHKIFIESTWRTCRGDVRMMPSWAVNSDAMQPVKRSQAMCTVWWRSVKNSDVFISFSQWASLRIFLMSECSCCQVRHPHGRQLVQGWRALGRLPPGRGQPRCDHPP